MNLVYHSQHRRLHRTEQNLIVHCCISEAEVTNNRILRLTYCTTEATDRHEASRGLSAAAELLVSILLLLLLLLRMNVIATL